MRRAHTRVAWPTHLNQVQNAQLALRRIHHEHKIQRRIVSVHDAQLLLLAAVLAAEELLELGRVQEVAQVRRAAAHQREDLLHEGLGLRAGGGGGLVDRGVEFGEASDAGGVDYGKP